MLFHAFLVESKKQFESCSSMEIFAAAQFSFPCFSLSQAHADLLLLVLKENSWQLINLNSVFQRAVLWLSCQEWQAKKVLAEITKKNLWCGAQSCLSKRFVWDKTIFIPLCSQRVQTHAEGGEKLSSSACGSSWESFWEFPSTLQGSGHIATQSSETHLKNNFKWLILVCILEKSQVGFRGKSEKKNPVLDNGYALCSQLMLWIRAAPLCIRLGFAVVLTLLHSCLVQHIGFWECLNT